MNYVRYIWFLYRRLVVFLIHVVYVPSPFHKAVVHILENSIPAHAPCICQNSKQIIGKQVQSLLLWKMIL